MWKRPTKIIELNYFQKSPKFSFIAFKYPKLSQFSGNTKIISMNWRLFLYLPVGATDGLRCARETYAGYTTYICSFRKLLFRGPFNAPLKRKSIILFVLCMAVEECNIHKICLYLKPAISKPHLNRQSAFFKYHRISLVSCSFGTQRESSALWHLFK